MPFSDAHYDAGKLSAYMDGELPPEEQAAVRDHLAGCPACAGQLRRLSAVDDSIRLLPREPAPPFFAARVSAAAKALDEYHGPLRVFLRFAVPAAAALTLFILFNIVPFSISVNAMDAGTRRALAGKVLIGLARPASVINPVALARLCGDCNALLCRCMEGTGTTGAHMCAGCAMGPDAENTEGHKYGR